MADWRTDDPLEPEEEVPAAAPVDDGFVAVNVVLIKNRSPVDELRIEVRLNKGREKIKQRNTVLAKSSLAQLAFTE